MAVAVDDTPPVPSAESVYRLPEKGEALYLRGVKMLGDIPNPKPAKGAVPRAKQFLGAQLNLPTRRYAHNIKLEDGKFGDLSVIKKVQGPAKP